MACRRSEPLQQWEQELIPGKEVECLIDRLKVRAGKPLGHSNLHVLTPPHQLSRPASSASSHRPSLCCMHLQAHFASTGPCKTAEQIKAQQAELMSKLPAVGVG